MNYTIDFKNLAAVVLTVVLMVCLSWIGTAEIAAGVPERALKAQVEAQKVMMKAQFEAMKAAPRAQQ